MQEAGEHGSEPDWMQYLLKVQLALLQSALVAQNAPPSRAQTPLSHLPDAQSTFAVHPSHTLPEQRSDPQASLLAQGSPTASLQMPALQTPLKQSEAWVHASPKCPAPLDPTHAPAALQIAADSQ
jgi:hypothetical protein